MTTQDLLPSIWYHYQLDNFLLIYDVCHKRSVTILALNHIFGRGAQMTQTQSLPAHERLVPVKFGECGEIFGRLHPALSRYFGWSRIRLSLRAAHIMT